MEGDSLLRLVAEVTGETVEVGERPVDGLRLAEDLGLDSLGRVQLQSLLERRLEVEVGDDAMARVETVGELRALMGAGDVATAESVGDEERVEERVEEAVYPRWPWSWPVKVVRVLFIELAMRPLVWLLGAPKVTREGEMDEQPMLIVANHVTAYDGALVLYALPWEAAASSGSGDVGGDADGSSQRAEPGERDCEFDCAAGLLADHRVVQCVSAAAAERISAEL